MNTAKFISLSSSTMLLKLATVIVVALIANVLISNAASASMATNSRLHGGNAWNYCHAGHPSGSPGPYAKGMVWISNVDSDYYSEAVNIGSADNSVRVSIRGAVNGCYTSWPGDRDFYAVDVTTSYLSAMSGSTLYRGRIYASGQWSWTTEGGKLFGNLDVSRVALCSASSLLTGSVTETISISISRRQQQYTTSGTITFDSPIVGTENVPITVTRACPTFSYDLRPSIDIADGTGVDTPLTRSVVGIVNNLGPTISRPDAPWAITKVVYGPGDAIPQKSGGTRTTAAATGPCAFFTGEDECDDTNYDGSRAAGYPVGNTNESASILIDEYAVGTRICFALSVRQYTQAEDGWRHSDLQCLIAGKKPKVNVVGGDLLVGRIMAGSVTAPSGRVVTSISGNSFGTFGSWVEYALASSGPVTNMASGSGYSAGNAANITLLTFANTGVPSASCSPALGCYVHGASLPNIGAKFRTTTANPVVASGSLSGLGSGIYRGSGAITIDASTIDEGESIIINAPTADVTISGNIQYVAGPFANASQIPQLVIIANNITIQAGVTNIDAWLIAPGTLSATNTTTGGVIRTCDVAPSAISESVCNEKLTVNGPVVANQLIMLRTGGAEAGEARGDPAEVFNFRPDAYMWAMQQAEVGGRITTVSTKELPPRY